MGVRFGELDSRQLDALRAELSEVLASHFAYPSFFGYRANRALTRPPDRAKRQEIAAFLQTLSFAPIGGFQVDAPETQRYLEGLFVRYLDANPDAAAPRIARHRGELRAHARFVASDIQREFLAFLAGTAPKFGSRRRPPSWADTAEPPSANAGDWIEHAPVQDSKAAPQAASWGPEDQQVFQQLRAQIDVYIRRAARGYGLPDPGGDPARVLDELRRSGLVEEANLSIAERILALADRVTAAGSATLDDYRQALTLYLLYHRSHLHT
jgi:hypothetical protein